MRIFKILLVTGLMISYPVFSKDYTVKSPDNRVMLSVQVGDEISISVSYQAKTHVTALNPALLVDGTELPGLRPGQPRSTLVDVTDTLRPVVPHKNKIIVDKYRGLSLRFKNGCSLVFRVYNDGVAYRFTTLLKGDITVTGERFAFSLPEGATSWYPLEKGFMSHNEQKFILSSMDTVEQKHLASLPALFMTDGINILLTEADINDYPGMWITGNGKGGVTGTFPAYPAAEKLERDRDVFVTEREDYIAKTSGTRSFPWRVFIITPDDAGLVESEMVYKLGAPPAPGSDFSWVKPGKVAWDWYNANNLFGVDFRAGLNNNTYK
jgi:alpha-glucosidase